MATLQIRKKSLKTWEHIDSLHGKFILSKFYFSEDVSYFQIVEQGEAKRRKYAISDIIVYDDTAAGTPETFPNITELSLRLEILKYPAFPMGFEGAVEDLISTQEGNAIILGDDGGLYVSSTGTNVRYRDDFTWVSPNPQSFTLPSGITPNCVYHNRVLLFETDYTVTGTITKTVTITYMTFDPSETQIITITN